MKWRTEIELRYVEFFTLIILAIITGMVAYFNTGSSINIITNSAVTPIVIPSHKSWLVPLGAFFFVTILFGIVLYKIKGESKAYVEWANIVQKIWIYFDLFEPDPKSGKSPERHQIICHFWDTTAKRNEQPSERKKNHKPFRLKELPKCDESYPGYGLTEAGLRKTLFFISLEWVLAAIIIFALASGSIL